MQRVSSQARAAELHSTDLQAELRHQQEVAEEKDAEIRRLQKVSKLAQPSVCSQRMYRRCVHAVSRCCTFVMSCLHTHAMYIKYLQHAVVVPVPAIIMQATRYQKML